MNAIDIVKQQLSAHEAGRNHAVVTIVQSDGATTRSDGKMLVYDDGTTAGTIGGGAVERLAIRDALACIQSGSNAYRDYDLTSPASESGMTCGGRLSVFIEAFIARPLLVMCGAGHVGCAVLKIADFVGFNTLLVDDREEASIANAISAAKRFVHVDAFEAGIRALDLPANSYIVIATHGHAFDGAALAGALTKQASYVGMIGSHKKIAALFQRLLKQGFSQAELDRVHTPIGLNLGGETPEEIALAIVAEILAVRYGRTVQLGPDGTR